MAEMKREKSKRLVVWNKTWLSFIRSIAASVKLTFWG